MGHNPASLREGLPMAYKDFTKQLTSGNLSGLKESGLKTMNL